MRTALVRYPLAHAISPETNSFEWGCIRTISVTVGRIIREHFKKFNNTNWKNNKKNRLNRSCRRQSSRKRYPSCPSYPLLHWSLNAITGKLTDGEETPCAVPDTERTRTTRRMRGRCALPITACTVRRGIPCAAKRRTY